jgi:hypothetical protein
MVDRSSEQAGPVWGPVARVLARDVLLPYVVYLGLRAAGVSNLRALVGGAVVALLLVVVDAIRRRRLNALSLLVMLTLVLSVVVALISGNARVTLARDCVITGGLGLLFLASLLRHHPVLYQVLAPLAAARSPDGEAGFAARYEQSPDLRAALRVTTAVWGVVLLADAALRLTAVALLPVPDAATAATALTIATVVVLVGWLRFYLPRRLRAA